METRIKTEVKLYKLRLITFSPPNRKVYNQVIAISYDPQQLIDLYNSNFEGETEIVYESILPEGVYPKFRYFNKDSILANSIICDHDITDIHDGLDENVWDGSYTGIYFIWTSEDDVIKLKRSYTFIE